MILLNEIKEKVALSRFKLGDTLMENEKGKICQKDNGHLLKKKGARDRVKRAIIRGENGALLAPGRGHLPEICFSCPLTEVFYFTYFTFHIYLHQFTF